MQSVSADQQCNDYNKDKYPSCIIEGCVYNHDGTPVPENVTVSIEYLGVNYTTKTKKISNCICLFNGTYQGNYYRFNSGADPLGSSVGYCCYAGLNTTVWAEYGGYYGQNSSTIGGSGSTLSSTMNIYLNQSRCTYDDTFNMTLVPGLNGFSLPLIPLNFSINRVLNSIESSYDIVRTVNPGDLYLYYAPLFGLSQFNTVEPDKGYQINVNASRNITLQITGMKTSAPCACINRSVTLVPGLNSFGWTSLRTKNITDALSSIEGSYDIVRTVNPGDLYLYYAPLFGLSQFNTIEPGKEYQININATQNVTLTYNPC